MIAIDNPTKSKRGGKRQGAGRKPNTQTENDITALIEALRPVRVGRNRYERIDRYRDARLVFSSDAGKRILAQIVDLCEGPPIREHEVESHAGLAYRQGMRFIGLQVLAWMNDTPSADAASKGTK